MNISPKACIFDVFGTVVDWRKGISTECKTWFHQKNIDYDAESFADLWRGEYQPAMERIRSGNRGYVPLDVLHLENLNAVLEQTGLARHFEASERKALNRAWEKLPAWPDSVNALLRLKETMIIAPCSNGSIALMTRLAKFADLRWDCILGAEIAGNYKPHPETYIQSVKALALEPEEVIMVAAHNDDLQAARDVGLKTAFIPRRLEHGSAQTTDLEPASDWDFVVETLEELADIFQKPA